MPTPYQEYMAEKAAGKFQATTAPTEQQSELDKVNALWMKSLTMGLGPAHISDFGAHLAMAGEGDPEKIADLGKKLATRDALVAAGSFVPPVLANAGFAPAVMGGALVGGALGETEAQLGGYNEKDRESLLKWGVGGGAGGVALGTVAGALIRSGPVIKALTQGLHKTMLSPEAAEAGTMWAQEVAAIQQAKTPKELIAEGKVNIAEAKNKAAKILRRISLQKFLKSPDAQRFAEAGVGPHDTAQALYDAAKEAELLPYVKRTIKPGFFDTPRSQAARDAYEAALGQPDAAGFFSNDQRMGAKTAARKAAADFTRAEVGAALNVATTARGARALEAGDPNSRWSAIRGMYVKAIEDVGTMLKRRVGTFGQVGQDLSLMLKQFANLEDMLVGNWTRISTNITKGLNASELENLHAVLHEGATPYNQKVANAYTKARMFFEKAAQFARESGIHEVEREMTVKFRALSANDQALAKKVLLVAENRQDFRPLLQEFKKAKVRELVSDMVRNRAGLKTIDGSDVVWVPFREMQGYAPKYFEPDAIIKATSDPAELARMQRVLAQSDPKWLHATRDEIIAKAYKIAGGEVTAGSEFRGGNLQWSREGMLSDKWLVKDPKVYIGRYAHDAARRIASARVFGGRDEMFSTLMERLRIQNASSLSQGLKATQIPVRDIGKRVRDAANTDMVKNILYTAIGRGAETPWTLREINNLATVRFIGFSSMLKQFGALYNVAGQYGFENTVAGVLHAIKDPKTRQVLDDIGVTAYDLPHMLVDQSASAGLARGVYNKTGLVLADRLVRRAAGTAAALRAAHAVDLLNSRIPAVREIAARDLIGLGISPADIVGGQLSKMQLRQAALQGAVQTQFTGRVHELPYFATTSLGKAAYYLKRFSVQQTNFFLNKALPELAKGNLRPLLDSAAMLGVVGIPTSALIKAVSSKKYDLLANFYFDAVWGSLSDLGQNVWSDPGRLVAGVTGPAGGVAAEFVGGVAEGVKGTGSALAGEPDEALEHYGKMAKHFMPNAIVQGWRGVVKLLHGGEEE